MRYPMWRRDIDGTESVVNSKEEAYANPERIKCFLPEKAIPETTTTKEANDGLQDEEVRNEEEVVEAPAKRGPGRPKKAAA